MDIYRETMTGSRQGFLLFGRNYFAKLAEIRGRCIAAWWNRRGSRRRPVFFSNVVESSRPTWEAPSRNS